MAKDYYKILVFVCAIVTAIFVVSGLFATASAQGISYMPSNPQIFGHIEGEGTHFEIENSDYFNITLDSSESIRARLESVSEIVTMAIYASLPPATSTTVTISGFSPQTTYYKYEDSYHNLTQFTTDENGGYSYTQDITAPHIIFIQPRKSTKFIRDDATGGDCSSVGNWNNTAKTCTLTQNVLETIEIDSDNIVLDGNNFTLSGSHTGSGVYLNSKSGVIVKNMHIENFSYGVNLNNSNGNRIENNDFVNLDNQGMVFFNSSTNTIIGNTVSLLVPSARRHQGFVLFDSYKNIFQDNTVSLNARASVSGRHQGILLFDSNDNSFVSNDVSDTYQGVLFFDSYNNVLRENTIRDSSEDGLMIFPPSSGNQASHNNFIGNPTQVINYGPAQIFSSPLPEGGNYWSDFDTPEEGCSDVNADGFCDAPYVFTGGQDDLPWVTQDGWKNSSNSCTQNCYSNVLFLPGLEASRLYQKDPGCLFLNCENKLWEPNRNDDVRKLYLSPTTGESVHPDTYTRDVIDEAFGVNIYKGFLGFMEGLVIKGTIKHFETLPYDWRDDQKDVVTRSIRLESGSYDIATRIVDLASTSPTGKVTLIAHSNGGLVAKELVEDLKSRGQENLIDRIILVAVPELGTPKAVFEMLHGAGPFFLSFPSKEVTRELAENMKSAYTLLPSREYFNRLRGPFVEFSTTTSVTQGFRNVYGNSISDYDTLRKFLRGENGARMEPQASAVNEPNVLKENFLANAETRHATQDTWMPPSGIEVIEIVGLGLDAPRGVEYKSTKKKVCSPYFSGCPRIDVIDPQPLVTSEGDSTVVYPSAEALGVERYYVDIFQHNKLGQFNVNRDHKNILEITPIQTLLTTLIKNEATSTLPLYITNTKPPQSDADKRLRIGVHSPVALHLYDSLGRHTGPITNPDPSSDLDYAEERIPNTYYWQIGEGQYAGASGEQITTIQLTGKDLGTFTLDIEEITGGTTTSMTIYEDIPVTASTIATIEAGGNVAPVLKVDIDGNGTIDAEITPGGLTGENLVGILKGLVKTLNLPDKKEKQLFKKLEKLEKELAKEHENDRKEKQKTKGVFKNVIKLINKYEKKNILSKEEAGDLIGIIEQIREKVVE
ncbi:MAG: Cell surface protein [Parcubacteria group bacterium GW2011_GWA1_47_8]|nr:MAG: Cell surface protein [Parcubacteria group bacterium GW2011_GWA1_47_8]